MARVVSIEITRAYIAPNPVDIIRSVGNPMDGVCQLAGGAEVTLF